ncbi:hypothetical protein ABA31_09960 [Agrococcus baldri]|uniref:Enoyl-(Acyl carrier protein) reductase n=1 Tax=Agrococcus baldri TaxID=153730 RepID=A0AA87RFX4_9MICO|nr:hypothetical protein ABA31_09960 [Agrococcus baldri]
MKAVVTGAAPAIGCTLAPYVAAERATNVPPDRGAVDMAEAVAVLAGDRPRYVSGHYLRVDGGPCTQLMSVRAVDA